MGPNGHVVPGGHCRRCTQPKLLALAGWLASVAANRAAQLWRDAALRAHLGEAASTGCRHAAGEGACRDGELRSEVRHFYTCVLLKGPL